MGAKRSSSLDDAQGPSGQSASCDEGLIARC
jgi:hypothetical protein